MFERWRKLFTAVTLVLFVFTNGVLSAHAGMRLSKCNCACDQSAIDSVDENLDGCEPMCAHCTAKTGSITAGANESAVLDPLASDESATPCDHDTCPCPDGCIYCSIAKVLGYTPTLPDLTFSFHVEQCVLESAPLYLPPIATRMIRPPRA